MDIKYRNTRFEHIHVRYLIGVFNSYAAHKYREERAKYVTWAGRQDRESSKLQTLARREWRNSPIDARTKRIWHLANRAIRQHLQKRVGRLREQWINTCFRQQKQVNKRGLSIKHYSPSILWTSRAQSETCAVGLRVRTYSYQTRPRNATTWQSAAEAAYKAMRFAETEHLPYQGRYADLWSLCFRYSKLKKHDRAYLN